MELEFLEKLSSAEVDVILGCLPERIHGESISFVDCKLNRGA